MSTLVQSWRCRLVGGGGLAAGSAWQRRRPFVASCASGGTGLAGDLAQVGKGGVFVVAGVLVVGVHEEALAGVVDGDGREGYGDGDQSDPADVDVAGRSVVGSWAAWASVSSRPYAATVVVLRRCWSGSSVGGLSMGPRVAGPGFDRRGG